MTRQSKYLSLLALPAVMLFASCQENATDKGNTTDSTATQAIPAIGVSDVPTSPEFPNAKLAMGNVIATPNGDSTKVSFDFIVSNYELKNQTADASNKQCNNSDKGQHIHFIMDNKPYVALYEPKHEITLANNTEHYLLAFLSRSYHESLKNKEAAVLYHFKIDEKGKLQKLETPTTPMVFYSRPKGNYMGKDTDNLLFDFYVWGATLGENYQVKANIHNDNMDTTLSINNWKAMFLHHLPMGTSTIKLTLVDKAGNKVEGPETEVSREFTLAKEEPVK